MDKRNKPCIFALPTTEQKSSVQLKEGFCPDFKTFFEVLIEVDDFTLWM
ncbi:hypothetical protein [Sandaracinomonas limnophila]|nr:hypothetical protein [Sandaracinomonas limnophila]